MHSALPSRWFSAVQVFARCKCRRRLAQVLSQRCGADHETKDVSRPPFSSQNKRHARDPVHPSGSLPHREDIICFPCRTLARAFSTSSVFALTGSVSLPPFFCSNRCLIRSAHTTFDYFSGNLSHRLPEARTAVVVGTSLPHSLSSQGQCSGLDSNFLIQLASLWKILSASPYLFRQP